MIAAGAAALPSKHKFPPVPESVTLRRGVGGYGLTLNGSAVIMRVAGAAAAAQLSVGSQIIAVNHKPVANKKEVMAEATIGDGDTLTITILPPWEGRRSAPGRPVRPAVGRQSLSAGMAAAELPPEPQPKAAAKPVAVILDLRPNELLTCGTTLSTVASTVPELILTITNRLLTNVADGLGDVFLARAMDERRSQAASTQAICRCL